MQNTIFKKKKFNVVPPIFNLRPYFQFIYRIESLNCSLCYVKKLNIYSPFFATFKKCCVNIDVFLFHMCLCLIQHCIL